MKSISRRSFVHSLGIGVAGITAISTLPSFMTNAKNTSKNNDDKKLGIALCGLGNYANILARGFENASFCKLSGLITGTPSKAERWKKQYAIPDKNCYNYENFDTIIDNKDIDLVYIVLPNSMHKEYTIRAAKAGKHVIVEKPMALNAKDCEEMITVCKQNKVQLAVGYRLHYEPFHQELMRLGQEKVFGNVRLIEASLGYRTTNATQWRLKKELAGGGPLMNIGIYAVQVARYVLGEEPESLTAQFGPVTNKKLFSEVEESITWQLNFPSGAVANSASTYSTNIDRFYAGAERGFFELSPALSYGPFQGRTSNGALEFPTINQQTAQMDGISKFILEDKPLPEHIAGIEGLKDMKIIDAIYSAASAGKKIDLITM